MKKNQALMILALALGTTVNTSIAQNLWNNDETASKKEAVRKEKMELINKILTQGEIISQGYEENQHSFVVVYKRKIFSCYVQYYAGGCHELREPMF